MQIWTLQWTEQERRKFKKYIQNHAIRKIKNISLILRFSLFQKISIRMPVQKKSSQDIWQTRKVLFSLKEEFYPLPFPFLSVCLHSYCNWIIPWWSWLFWCCYWVFSTNKSCWDSIQKPRRKCRNAYLHFIFYCS